MVEAVLRHDERDAAAELEARARAVGMHPDLRELFVATTPAKLVEQLRPFVTRGVGDFMLVVRPPIDYCTLELFAREVAGELRI
jgi:hypothetical protein